MTAPICVKCGRKMYMETVGVVIVENTEKGDPYKIWSADLWQCPVCLNQVYSGYGERPISEHYRDDFQDKLKLAKDEFV